MIIGKREIGHKFMPLIVCELGINHGGSLPVAIWNDPIYYVNATLMQFI